MTCDMWHVTVTCDTWGGGEHSLKISAHDTVECSVYSVQCTLYSCQHAVYSVQCTIIVYCIILLYSVLGLIFVNQHNTILYYSTGVCCKVMFFFNIFYYLIWCSIYFFIHFINYVFFVGKNCECLHNIILLHLNFIFLRGRPAKTANVYTT